MSDDTTSDEQKYDSGYKAGVIAAKLGKSKADNPYYQNTAAWRGWVKGFDDASKKKTD